MRAAVRDPYEAMERARERWSEWYDRRVGCEQPSLSADWERLLHLHLDQPWPCTASLEFSAMFDQVTTSLSKTGLEIGRGAYGGWDDGDAALARAVWCAARHMKPQDVVETGVARGITSRFVLEALEINGAGRLWSVDIAPLLEPGLRRETGVAVPARLRHRWRYLEGSSRKRLPVLLDVLGNLDLFIHDSMHTTRNVAFELKTAWEVLRPGGVMIVDDVDKNSAFAGFARTHPDDLVLAGPADDERATIGIAFKTASVEPERR